jgi:GGDEF domain-containing protein
LTVVAALAIGGIYLVLRTGWNRRLADPALTEAQMWVGIVLLGWGYLIGGPGRPVALILLFVILMFALLTVTFRQMTRASALAVLVFGAASLGVVGREGALPLTVDLQVLYFCVLLIILSCACVLVRQLSLLRERAAHARHDLAEAMAKLHGQVIRDELTGLFNRRHMHKLLRIEQSRADRSGFPWCVAMIDLDLFKHVNDEHGHAVGDEVLRSTAQVLSGGLRGADQVARWGGEEFLVMFPDTDSDDACQVLDRIGLWRAPRSARPCRSCGSRSRLA